MIFYYNSSYIIKYFTLTNVSEVKSISIIYSLSIILISISYYLGGNRLLPFGFNLKYSKVMFFNFLIYTILFLILYFSNFISLFSITLIYLITELFCCIYLFIMVKNMKLLW